MNAPNSRPMMQSDSQKKDRSGRWLACLTLLLVVAAFLLWKTSSKSPRLHAPLDPRPATQIVPVDQPMNAAATVTQKSVSLPLAVPSTAKSLVKTDLPAALPAEDAPTPAPATETGMIASIFERLTKIDTAIEKLSAQVTKLSAAYAASTAAKKHASEVANKAVSKADDDGTAKEPLRRNPHPAIAVAKADTAVPAGSGTGPDVLSVDTWNGNTSVAVRHGVEISFLGEGDRVGNYELKRADTQSQRAWFADLSGKVVVKDRVRQ